MLPGQPAAVRAASRKIDEINGAPQLVPGPFRQGPPSAPSPAWARLEEEETPSPTCSGRRWGCARCTRRKTLGNLPVHRRLKARNGVVIQTFEDLWTGYNAKYGEAAHRLGLEELLGSAALPEIASRRAATPDRA